MKVLIFATYVKGELTNDLGDEYVGFNVKGGNTKIVIAIDDLNLSFNYISQFGSQGNTNSACKEVEELAKSYKKDEEIKIYIHYNSRNLDPNDIRDEIKNRLGDIPVYFYHHPADPSWKTLTKIKEICQGGSLETGKEEEFKNYFMQLWDATWEIKKKITLLKHRIAHLFLPIDIDLQGIYEVNKINNGDAIKYLNEVLGEKEKNISYYRQRLTDLWYILVKGKMENGKWKIEKERKIENGKLEIEYFEKIVNISQIPNCKPVPPRQDCDKFLADEKQAVIDLLVEDGKLKIKNGEKKQEIINWWKKLLMLCGLQYNNKNPFNKTQIYPSNSEILQFMCVLDCKIQKCSQEKNPISNSDIDEILKFEMLDKILGSNFLHLKSDISFHWWFCSIDDCLDKLRRNLG